ncbi:MAG: hypothetical protein ACM3TT_10635 [Syntrophothermus sp.]
MVIDAAFDEVSVAEARNRFSELTRNVTDRNKLVRVKRQKAGHGEVYWLPEKVWHELLSFVKFNVSIERDPITNLWDVREENLGVSGSGETKDEAAEDFLDTLLIAAQDYFENADFYLRQPNLAHRLPYYLKIASAGAPDKVRSILGL